MHRSTRSKLVIICFVQPVLYDNHMFVARRSERYAAHETPVFALLLR